jgi:hypothetical protein
MNVYVELDLPEAIYLADYTGIQIDLKTAKQFIELLGYTYPSGAEARNITDALTTAILVRYFRAFGGIRAKSWWEEGFACLTQDERDMHQHLKDIRDKHIAHSLNFYEENRPTARYWTDSIEQEGFQSIECNHIRVIGLGGQEIVTLISVIDKLEKFLVHKISEEKTRIMEIVRQMPVKKVLAMGIKPYAPTDSPSSMRQKPAHSIEREKKKNG